MIEHCPRHVALSAYVDEELAGGERQALEAHLRGCPVCGAQLEALQDLRQAFRALPQETPGFDLGSVIEGRLASAAAPARSRARRGRWSWLPLTGAGTAALLLGAYMGLALLGGGAVAPRAAVMSVFDPLPPGNLCLAQPSCYPKGAKP